MLDVEVRDRLARSLLAKVDRVDAAALDDAALHDRLQRLARGIES
jgi:hypothetical protein